ncbi:odorant receptor Or2-like isoform X2 [Megalopta genalis]|uniref:odorant receptor Or2-like isoform X2 n=1 Tax=Megalopta genalis TaxID=115081 RepID=UPI003FCF6BB4
MEVFDGNYKFYHTLMCLTGLWPYDKSILTYIQRFVVLVMTFTCIASQICILTSVKVSLNEIIVMISFGSTLFLYFLRYSTSVVLFPVMTFVFDNMQRDFSQLKDPVELKILLEDSIVAKRIVQAYFAMVCTGGLCLVGSLGISTFVDSDIQLHFLNLLGFFYKERSQQSAFTCWHITLTTVYGLLTLTCTEGSVTVFASYISGMLKIASYRMQNAVNTVANSRTTKTIDIRSAMEMHRRAIFYAHRYTKDIMLLCLLLTLVVIVAFGVNLYGFFISITESNDRDAMMLSVHFVMAYTTFICGNNYSGQLVLDSSGELFRETYNSLWYRIPAKMQKLVLFSLMRSRSDVAFNLAGLFTPCYEGFTMMMSSSFSYFTLLCSV